MKKILFQLVSFCAAICLFVACNTQRRAADATIICPTALYDEGVVINGVRWATRNVDAPGTFADSPASVGMFYSIDRGWWQAWEIASGNPFPLQPTNIHIDSPIGPCPPGWRMPTDEEFRSLISAGSEVVRMGSIYGRLFGIAPNQIFLPATGHLSSPSVINPMNPTPFIHTILFEGRRGSYWSRYSLDNRVLGRGSLYFSTVVDFIRLQRGGSSIRCVAR